MNTTDINQILAKHFSEEQLSAMEQKELEIWIKENSSEYSRLCSIMNDSSTLNEPNFNPDKAWDKVKARIDAKKAHGIGSIIASVQKHRKTTILRIASVAATVIFFMALGISYQIYINHPITVLADAGCTKTVILPDKSAITLNHGSQIRYKRNFARKRNVKLQGEGFFEVTPDKASPFTVETAMADIKVLGTSFNVKEENNQLKVNVKTGHVAVISGDSRTELLKGESACVTSTKIIKENKVSADYLWWKEKKLIFDNTPLNQVIEMLNKYYNIQIVSSENTESYHITTTFTTESPQEAVNELKAILHFDYRMDGTTYTIYNIRKLK